ncbi:MAG: glycosyltransferase family 39 protein [Chloroflexi bacterium]|nr:glycosyltransferase family 39 protein [Chloroflexota bacterium]
MKLIVEGAAGDIHPPGYYLALAGWRALTGESEFALRALSAFAGVILVALIFRLGREYFDRPAALGAAFFAAIHPALIYYSQEARMYSLVAALGAATFLLASRWLRASPSTLNPPRLAGAGYVLIVSAGLYTHYSFAFVLVAVNLAAVGGMAFHRRELFRPRAARWIGLQLAALLLFAPWLGTAVHQVTTWPSAREYHPFIVSFLGVSRWLLLGQTIDAAQAVPGLIGMAGLFLLALRRRGQIVTPLIWLLVSAGFILGLGFFSEAFAKFLIGAVPAACLVLGSGVGHVAHLSRRYFQRIGNGKADAQRPHPLFRLSDPLEGLLAIVFGVLIVWTTGVALINLYFSPAYARDDYRAIARLVASNSRPGDAVLLIAPNQWEVFTYYHRSGAEVFPLPRTRPLDPIGTETDMEKIAAKYDRLFVLWWGEAQADPDRFVESWLNSRAFKALDQWYGHVRLSTYAVSRQAAKIESPLALRFGDSIALEGFTLKNAALAPGDILQLTLFWRAEKRVTGRYKVFVHVTADDGAPLAQQDGEPGGGLRPTSDWKPGEQVPDNHGILLPAALPPGEYRVIVGLYRLDDGVRLSVSPGGGDSLFLSLIRVK